MRLEYYLSVLRRIHTALLITIISVIVIGVIVVLAYGYSVTPDFLFSIRDDIENNAAVMENLGENRGQELSYSKFDMNEGDTASFYVKIMGVCDSNYIKVRGVYFLKKSKYEFTVRDTLIVNKCH